MIPDPAATRRAAGSLIQSQNPDGGWGASADRPSTTEITSLATLAMRGLGDPAVLARERRGLAWLRARQRKDGGWSATDAVSTSGWMTSLAVIALADSRSDRQRALAGARWLLQQEGRGYPWLTRLFFRLFPSRDVIDLDAGLTGWAWFHDTFSWVEPTACALIALKTVRADLPPEPTAARIREAEQMILDRSCAGGGWNYGNSRVYDEELWPYPDTTALALIALQDRPELPEVSAGLSALSQMLDENHSVLATSLGLLCFRAFGHDDSGLGERLHSRLDHGPEWTDTRALALAALALNSSKSFGFTHA
ncbi:MAG: prenyltransferase/squalene oxidase repeat-containing protein [Gemmatimonadota bacterium]